MEEIAPPFDEYANMFGVFLRLPEIGGKIDIIILFLL